MSHETTTEIKYVSPPLLHGPFVKINKPETEVCLNNVSIVLTLSVIKARCTLYKELTMCNGTEDEMSHNIILNENRTNKFTQARC